MLNLKELEEKLDAVLANETEETLTAWIEYKRAVQLLRNITNGTYSEEDLQRLASYYI